MKEHFRAIVDGQYAFEWDEENLNGLQIQHVEGNRYHMLWNNQSLYVDIQRADFERKMIELIIRGRVYHVQIEDTFDLLVERMGLTREMQQQIKEIRAPMPGLILDILVENGQEVSEESHVLVLEAMKMENIITSPVSAIIQEVMVTKGDAVEKGQILIKLD